MREILPERWSGKREELQVTDGRCDTIKTSKYKASKVEIDGIVFDSKREASRYCELRLLERTGEISNLEMQKRYELIPKQGKERAVHYVADFVYKNKAGVEVVEDTKGMRTRDYIIKRKLMLWVHGITIKEV